MALDPHTPVLVGVGVVQQREEDPALAAEPLELMARALERAAEDAGDRSLLSRAGEILLPRGFWDYADPGRALADRFGASSARSLVAEVGVLQTTLFGRAAAQIAEGRADVVLVTGGEAKYRSLRAKITGGEALLRETPGEPDTVMRPAGEIIHPLEMQHGIAMPVNCYAIMENALRFAEGQSVAEHRDSVAKLWAAMSDVAERNPDAWRRERVAPAHVRDAADGNRMLAFPYTKLHNSQWNVDQAAGLVFASVEAARAAGIPEDRWIFPWSVVESNHMTNLTVRKRLHRVPGFAHAGAKALEHAGRKPDEIDHLELYSCFPMAVRAQCREIGIPEDRPHTVTGGMAFAGGPLNNFVLQAQARMVQVLRGAAGSLGMVNAVSGFLTKQGVSLWSSEPPPRAFQYGDVSSETERDVPILEIAEAAGANARIAGYTVLYEDDAPARAVFICDLEDGKRTLATCSDPTVARLGTEAELCGREVRLSEDGDVALA
ncbi:MAG: acetyl-CoA acetyltransferase [Deltaproteobacteria bacterium]|nr:acetyl-CoA acetyltransferase [Deltaproteobacteria bacterium]MBW2359601.1 acetyl-CoA acetyltransferase [Deltaproteobacteria bacterium]